MSAYTRETGAALSLKYHKFIHHIDRNLDDGINMLVRDLALVGCVEFVRLLPRPNLPQTMLNSTGDEMRTDGNLTVVHLKNCAMPMMQYSRTTPLIPVRPRNRFVRYLRTQVLLYKSDVDRAIVPTLVKQYLDETEGDRGLAKLSASVPSCGQQHGRNSEGRP